MALLTSVKEHDYERIYYTRFGTVVSYVEASAHGRGLDAVVEPGPIAFPAAYAAAADLVRQAMLAELAKRLGVGVSQVLTYSIDAIRAIADPPAYRDNPWRGRSLGRRQ